MIAVDPRWGNWYPIPTDPQLVDFSANVCTINGANYQASQGHAWVDAGQLMAAGSNVEDRDVATWFQHNKDGMLREVLHNLKFVTDFLAQTDADTRLSIALRQQRPAKRQVCATAYRHFLDPDHAHAWEQHLQRFGLKPHDTNDDAVVAAAQYQILELLLAHSKLTSLPPVCSQKTTFGPAPSPSLASNMTSLAEALPAAERWCDSKVSKLNCSTLTRQLVLCSTPCTGMIVNAAAAMREVSATTKMAAIALLVRLQRPQGTIRRRLGLPAPIHADPWQNKTAALPSLLNNATRLQHALVDNTLAPPIVERNALLTTHKLHHEPLGAVTAISTCQPVEINSTSTCSRVSLPISSKPQPNLGFASEAGPAVLQLSLAAGKGMQLLKQCLKGSRLFVTMEALRPATTLTRTTQGIEERMVAVEQYVTGVRQHMEREETRQQLIQNQKEQQALQDHLARVRTAQENLRVRMGYQEAALERARSRRQAARQVALEGEQMAEAARQEREAEREAELDRELREQQAQQLRLAEAETELRREYAERAHKLDEQTRRIAWSTERAKHRERLHQLLTTEAAENRAKLLAHTPSAITTIDDERLVSAPADMAASVADEPKAEDLPSTFIESTTPEPLASSSPNELVSALETSAMGGKDVLDVSNGDKSIVAAGMASDHDDIIARAKARATRRAAAPYARDNTDLASLRERLERVRRRQENEGQRMQDLLQPAHTDVHGLPQAASTHDTEDESDQHLAEVDETDLAEPAAAAAAATAAKQPRQRPTWAPVPGVVDNLARLPVESDAGGSSHVRRSSSLTGALAQDQNSASQPSDAVAGVVCDVWELQHNCRATRAHHDDLVIAARKSAASYARTVPLGPEDERSNVAQEDMVTAAETPLSQSPSPTAGGPSDRAANTHAVTNHHSLQALGQRMQQPPSRLATGAGSILRSPDDAASASARTPDSAPVPLEEAFNLAVLGPLRAQCQIVQAAIMAYLRDDLGLAAHMEALHRMVLHGDGDFSHAFGLALNQAPSPATPRAPVEAVPMTTVLAFSRSKSTATAVLAAAWQEYVQQVERAKSLDELCQHTAGFAKLLLRRFVGGRNSLS
ncbi:uncharacterized protein MONBRDRAFT_36820 [Monosiga brevicollis MX1]|uniref:Uncharacterized protein n=1 Tax=Monosiga brevicollis TaxID=81824 RepID=A9UXZ5_MONBE|nr:uncharacterized protein MONBRDRAFT_36820 [Monosiga brevicollis MX1]EDQ89932.1 predicted protein [Monosiga brevicollis MX1]|eukprot:XP_001745354.1 hypothetical protein [Monosiga brevicollis MX1]